LAIENAGGKMGSKVMWTFRIVMMLTSLVTVIYLIQYLHSGGLEKSKNPMMELLGAGGNSRDSSNRGDSGNHGGSGGENGKVSGVSDDKHVGSDDCSQASAANTDSSGICKIDSAAGSTPATADDGINARVVISHKRPDQSPTEKPESKAKASVETAPKK
jgi:hypothetical protein